MEKIRFIFIMLLLIGAMQANAQNGIAAIKQLSVEERAAKATDKLNQIVSLSPEQYQKVLAINKDFFVKRDALRAEIQQTSNASENAFKPKMAALFKERRIEVALSLNEYQAELYRTWRKQNRQQLMEKRTSDEVISDDELDAVEIM